MTVALVLGIALLGGALVGALIRIERGPSTLDRVVGLDIVTAVLIGGITLEAAWNRRVDTEPILVALAMVGFISSVTIARFAAVEPEEEGRIMSAEEVAEMEAERLAAEEADLRTTDDEHHGGPAQGEVIE